MSLFLVSVGLLALLVGLVSVARARYRLRRIPPWAIGLASAAAPLVVAGLLVGDARHMSESLGGAVLVTALVGLIVVLGLPVLTRLGGGGSVILAVAAGSTVALLLAGFVWFGFFTQDLLAPLVIFGLSAVPVGAVAAVAGVLWLVIQLVRGKPRGAATFVWSAISLTVLGFVGIAIMNPAAQSASNSASSTSGFIQFLDARSGIKLGERLTTLAEIARSGLEYQLGMSEEPNRNGAGHPPPSSTTVLLTVDPLTLGWADVDGNGIMRVAILGDSYISGEGAKEYISHTDAFAPGGSANNCHRSVLSWAYQIAAELVGPHRIGNAGVGNTDPDGDVLFVACSGATTDDMRMENPKAGGEHQLNALRAFEQGHPTDIVFLSIGGNDAGFADAIELCLTGDCLKDDFVNIQLALADEVETRVEQLVRDIRAIAPRATVYIVGYPDPLRPTPQNCARVGVPEGIDEDIADVPVVGQAAADLIAGGRIDDDEQAWVSQGFLPELNDAVERGAVSAGAVVLAEVEAAFTGHGVCSEEPFAWGVMPGEDVPALAADYGVGILGRESFHPTADGYRRLQDVLRAALVETDPTTSSLQK